MTRREFFAGLYILGCANGLLGRMIQSIDFHNSPDALSGVDTNVIVLFACFAGISFLLSAERDELRPMDLGVAVPFLALVILPIFPMSWVAVTGLSLYILLFANGNWSSDRARGALILLALTVPMLWSRLLFQFFATTILDIDAMLVASLLGTHQTGNMVQFADSSGYMVVLPRCSSLANMSLAFLCWVSITQWVKHRWTAMDLVWSGLACASVIAVNVTRISLMGLSHGWYTAIHGEWGDLVTNSVMLALMLAFSLLGARRELFRSGARSGSEMTSARVRTETAGRSSHPLTMFKWSIALLLPLTLLWKVALRPGDSAEAAGREKTIQRNIAEFLIRQHFVVSLADKMGEGEPSIRASAGGCRLLVAKSPALGWDRDVIRRFATADDRVFVVYRGKVYGEQPTFLTVSDNLWARFLRELGFGGQAAPVLAVIATTTCEAERLPWNELG
jgi:hypothetical protein